MVFFCSDTLPRLDSSLLCPYEQEMRGAPPYDPAMMTCVDVCLLVGVFSSRKMALACERHVRLSPLWVMSARTFATSVISARTILRRSWSCLSKSCAWPGRGTGEAWQCVTRWHQNPGQCVASPSDELRRYEEGSGAVCATRSRRWSRRPSKTSRMRRLGPPSRR